MNDMITGYHFTSDLLRNGDPIPPIGQWLKHGGDIEPCKSGLHASEHPFDAMQLATGNLLHHVELRGDLQPHGDPVDKWAGRERKILATINATELLRTFARWCALQVMEFWDAPQVVHDYLETGDASLRATAREAAVEAAEAAALKAAWASWEAAVAAAWAATWAAREAAWASAWAWAAWDVSGEASGLAARAAQRNEFSRLVDQAFEGVGNE